MFDCGSDLGVALAAIKPAAFTMNQKNVTGGNGFFKLTDNSLRLFCIINEHVTEVSAFVRYRLQKRADFVEKNDSGAGKALQGGCKVANFCDFFTNNKKGHDGLQAYFSICGIFSKNTLHFDQRGVIITGILIDKTNSWLFIKPIAKSDEYQIVIRYISDG